MADEAQRRRADATAVTLTPHDARWIRVAASESARIAAVLPGLVAVEHIGSTAILGIAAKPTIDLMPIIRQADDLDGCRAPMETLGYLWRGEYGIPGRRYSVLERDDLRLFHVHIYAAGSDQIVLQLAFRDYLRAHPDAAAAYEMVKREAAIANPANSMAYNDHKSAWIRACQQRALAWRRAEGGPCG